MCSAVLTGCYEDEAAKFRNQSLTAIPAEKTVFYDDVFKLEVDFQPWFGIQPRYTYASSDPWVATVDESGRVFGQHIGVCTITAATTGELSSVQEGLTATCTVTVASSGNLYPDPYLQFGNPPDSVKAYENREWVYDGPNQQGDHLLRYLSNNEFNASVNYFFNNNGDLFWVDAYVNKTEFTRKTVYAQLYERYDIGIVQGVPFTDNNTVLYMEDREIYVEVNILDDAKSICTSYYK
ncbi:MAG: hypothetical protein LBR08_04605 [Bacteroidales bacterium]|jgi:hypothetical protein|nr:hypothetical protein [Bacteroidales bacterium]